jgi:hypothetical protein
MSPINYSKWDSLEVCPVHPSWQFLRRVPNFVCMPMMVAEHDVIVTHPYSYPMTRTPTAIQRMHHIIVSSPHDFSVMLM